MRLMAVLITACLLVACSSVRGEPKAKATTFTVEPGVWVFLSNFGGDDWKRVTCKGSDLLCAHSVPDSMDIRLFKVSGADVGELVPVYHGHLLFENSWRDKSFSMLDSTPRMVETASAKETLVWTQRYVDGGKKQSIALGCEGRWCVQFTIGTHDEVDAFVRRLFRGVSLGK